MVLASVRVEFTFHVVKSGVVLGQAGFQWRVVIVPNLAMLLLNLAALFSAFCEILLRHLALLQVLWIDLHEELSQFNRHAPSIDAEVPAVSTQHVLAHVLLGA